MVVEIERGDDVRAPLVRVDGARVDERLGAHLVDGAHDPAGARLDDADRGAGAPQREARLQRSGGGGYHPVGRRRSAPVATRSVEQRRVVGPNHRSSSAVTAAPGGGDEVRAEDEGVVGVDDRRLDGGVEHGLRWRTR